MLSAFAYRGDILGFESYLRWFLILLFMAAKAGLVVAVFMHMKWDRLALSYAILGPPLVLGVLIWMMTLESDYTFATRGMFFAGGS